MRKTRICTYEQSVGSSSVLKRQVENTLLLSCNYCWEPTVPYFIYAAVLASLISLGHLEEVNLSSSELCDEVQHADKARDIVRGRHNMLGKCLEDLCPIMHFV